MGMREFLNLSETKVELKEETDMKIGDPVVIDIKDINIPEYTTLADEPDAESAKAANGQTTTIDAIDGDEAEVSYSYAGEVAQGWFKLSDLTPIVVEETAEEITEPAEEAEELEAEIKAIEVEAASELEELEKFIKVQTDLIKSHDKVDGEDEVMSEDELAEWLDTLTTKIALAQKRIEELKMPEEEKLDESFNKEEMSDILVNIKQGKYKTIFNIIKKSDNVTFLDVIRVLVKNDKKEMIVRLTEMLTINGLIKI